MICHVKQKRVLVIVPKPFIKSIALSQALAQTFELACDRAIENLVTNTDDQSAKNRWVDAERYVLGPRSRKHIPFDRLLLILIKGESARYLRRFAFKVGVIHHDQLARLDTREELIQQGSLALFIKRFSNEFVRGSNCQRRDLTA